MSHSISEIPISLYHWLAKRIPLWVSLKEEGEVGGVGDHFPLECIAISKTGWHTLHIHLWNFDIMNLYKEVLGITNGFLFPSKL